MAAKKKKVTKDKAVAAKPKATDTKAASSEANGQAGGAAAAAATGAAAAPPLPPREGVERASYVEALPCKLDASEIAALEEQLVKITCERVAQEATIAGLKEIVKGLKTRENSVVAQLKDDAVDRDVTVREILYVETCSVDVIRTDTGEIVRSRTATREDLQMAIAIDLSENEAAKLVDDAFAKAAAAVAAQKPAELPLADGPHDITDPAAVLQQPKPPEPPAAAKPDEDGGGDKPDGGGGEGDDDDDFLGEGPPA
jgi:hypothetical protein